MTKKRKTVTKAKAVVAKNTSPAPKPVRLTPVIGEDGYVRLFTDDGRRVANKVVGAAFSQPFRVGAEDPLRVTIVFP